MRIKRVMAWIIVSMVLLIVGMVGGSVTSSALADNADKNNPPPETAQAPDTGKATQDAQEYPEVVYMNRGSYVDQFAVYASTDAIATSSVAWVATPYYQYIVVPAGVRALINARYSAESVCYRLTAVSGQYCRLRMLIYASGVAPVEMNPPVGVEFAFDTPGYWGSANWESHSIDRHYVVPARSTTTAWYVRVYYSVTNAGLRFRLDDGQLTLEKARIP